MSKTTALIRPARPARAGADSAGTSWIGSEVLSPYPLIYAAVMRSPHESYVHLQLSWLAILAGDLAK